MKLTKSKLKEMIGEELLNERGWGQDIDKMADEIVSKSSYYAKNIKHYIGLDADAWSSLSNGEKKYEAMQKLLTLLNKELDKFGKAWITKYQKSVDRIMKS